MKWIKSNCDIKPTLLSQRNSWLLNAIHFSQFGCCNSEILLFSKISQDTNCATFRWMWYRAYHNFECDTELTTTLIDFIDLDESNSILASWPLLEKLQYFQIATSKFAEINNIHKTRLPLWHWNMFHAAITFIYFKQGPFFVAQFFSPTPCRILYNRAECNLHEQYISMVIW